MLFIIPVNNDDYIKKLSQSSHGECTCQMKILTSKMYDIKQDIYR